MITIRNVYKKLGTKQVLKNLSIDVEQGSIFGLIGPNGAGKTTLIKSLVGIYRIDRGQISVLDEDVFDNPNIKKYIGYVADYNDYFISFKIKDVIKFYKLAYESFSMERFNELNKIFKIPDNTYVRRLSKGMKTRLAIMLNLSIMPKLLVLDEPTSGLDPIIKKQLMNILLDEVADRGTTIFISSHNLSDLERICDSVAILNNGEIKYSNTIENMKKNIRKLQVVFNERVPDGLDCWNEIINVSKIGRVYNIITKEYNDDLKNKFQDAGVAFIEEIDLSLEEMFIYSVNKERIYE